MHVVVFDSQKGEEVYHKHKLFNFSFYFILFYFLWERWIQK